MIDPLLQHAVADQDYLTPTPIQEKSIPYLLEGRDLLGCAQTGTGKTAAFLLPILHRLRHSETAAVTHKPRALILAPTRELAAQTANSVTTYGRYVGIPFAVVFGGVSQFPQVTALKRGAVLIVATPGRLLDLMEQGHISLDGIEEFVLDEADRMLDMGFLPDIKKILAALPEKRHTQFFSATLQPEVMRLAMSMVVDPVHVNISPDKPTVDKINQKIMFVEKSNKDNLLAHLLETSPEMAKVVVFARTRHGSDRVERRLQQAGIRAEAIHSDKTQRARTNTLSAFRKGTLRVLVATDIASRGIDVDGVTHVVNFDLPEEAESYVHRIGRTARAGADGAAFSFVSSEDRKLLRNIERFIRKSIEVDNTHPFHSEKAELSVGKTSATSLPRPSWQRPKRQAGGGERRFAGASRSRSAGGDHLPSRPGGKRRPQGQGFLPQPELPAQDGARHAQPQRPSRTKVKAHLPLEKPKSRSGKPPFDAQDRQQGNAKRKRSFSAGKKPKTHSSRPPWMT